MPKLVGSKLVASTDLSATGTKDSTTFLRGDDTWAAPSGISDSGLIKNVGYDERTGTVADTSNPYNICTVTVSAARSVLGQRYRVRGIASPNANAAGSYTYVDIKYGVGASTGGTVLARAVVDHRLASRAGNASISADWVSTIATGTAFNFVLVGTPGGTGGLQAAGNTLTVEEVLP